MDDGPTLVLLSVDRIDGYK